MQVGSPTAHCRLFARSCSAAVVLDTYSPRPGLSTVAGWRREPGPLSFSILAPIAYELCFKSCRTGIRAAHGISRAGTITSLWREAVSEIASLGLGNPGMGSTLLLAFQAASLGYSLEAYGSNSVEHVMGSSMVLAEAEGVEGAVNFYRVLQRISPSYLGRISASGLPDVATRSLALDDIRAKGITLLDLLEKASSYDPVARDLYTGFTISLGFTLPIVTGGGEVLEAIARATYAVAGWVEDLILKRKIGRSLRGLWEAAFRGSSDALTMLKIILGQAGVGPGSSADIVVNAAARAVYEYMLLVKPRAGTS